jgi:hypothetical protein
MGGDLGDDGGRMFNIGGPQSSPSGRRINPNILHTRWSVAANRVSAPRQRWGGGEVEQSGVVWTG